MFIPADAETTVRFAQDTLSPGARGRNGDIKTIGLHVGAGSFATAIPEVPFIAITPVNSKEQITRSCMLAWPMTDSPAVLDAVLQVQGFTAVKRKAVAGLVADDTDPAVELNLDEPTPVTVRFGPTCVSFTQDERGGIEVSVTVQGREVHFFGLTADDVATTMRQQDAAAINWERRP